jgi:AcrR family transcriptional regulator
MMTSKKRGRKPLDSEAISKGREMLVAEARARFTEFGVQNVSIRKITDGVGMSPMSFYRYFPNKRAVLVHIWNDIFLDLATDCRAATANQSTPRDALLAYCDRYVDYWLRNPDYYLMVYCEVDRPEHNESYFAQSELVQAELNQLRGYLSALQLDPKEVEFTLQHIICSLIGICHSHITIPELGWQSAATMVHKIIFAILPN